jgi:hypothetical protein
MSLRLLSPGARLRRLDVSACAIGDAGAEILAEALPAAPLQWLQVLPPTCSLCFPLPLSFSLFHFFLYISILVPPLARARALSPARLLASLLTRSL